MRHPHPETTRAIDDALKTLTSLRDDLIARPSETTNRAERVIKSQRAIIEQHPEHLQPILAATLSQWAIALSNLGRFDEAIAASFEAVSILRDLSAQGVKTHTEALASSLDLLAKYLACADREDEALEPLAEMVEVNRTLAKQDPDRYNPQLALSLHRYGVYLDKDDRPSEALEPSLESVDMYRSLAEADASTYTAKLANALYYRAYYLDRDGSTRQALPLIQEAIAMGRTLADEDDGIEHTSNLALWLHMYATYLARDGHPSKALEPNDDSIELYRSLTKYDAHEYYPLLADALYDQARYLRRLGSVRSLFSRQGRSGNPKVMLEEVVRIRERMAARDPDNDALDRLLYDTRDYLRSVQLGIDRVL